ncbi:MAG: hypothetical protein AB7V02_14040, partial [Parvularculaceae bacterium]
VYRAALRCGRAAEQHAKHQHECGAGVSAHYGNHETPSLFDEWEGGRDGTKSTTPAALAGRDEIINSPGWKAVFTTAPAEPPPPHEIPNTVLTLLGLGCCIALQHKLI